MDIIFYKLQNEVNDVKKTRTLTATSTYTPLTVSGTLKSQASKINPMIDFAKDITYFSGYNYCYIADFGRYYFVDDMISIRTGITTISFRVDVLTSFLTQSNITGIEGFVGRTAKSTKYEVMIPDKRIQFKTNPLVTVTEPTSASSGALENVTFSTNATYNIVVNTINNEQSPREVTNITVPSNLADLVNGSTSGGTEYIDKQYFRPSGSSYTYVTDLGDAVVINNYPLSDLCILLAICCEDDNKAKCITNIMVFPFSVPKSTNKTIVYLIDDFIPDPRSGHPESDKVQMYSAKGVNSGFLILKDFVLATHDINESDTFLDYEPYTKYELFVPYVGWVPISLKENNRNFITVFYNVDYTTGQGTAYVYNRSKKAIIFQSSVQLGIRVPVNSSNAYENEIKDQNYTRNYITGLLASAGAVAGGIGTSNPVMLVGGLAGIAKTSIDYVNNEGLLLDRGVSGQVSNQNATAGTYGGMKVLQRITKLQPINYDSNFISHQGLPTNKILKLSDIQTTGTHTYCEVTDLHTTTENGLYSIGDITYNEVEELKKLCGQGIYL